MVPFTILAVDPGSVSGFSVFDMSGRVDNGVLKFPKVPSWTEKGEVWYEVTEAARDLIDKYDPTHIAIEKVAFHGKGVWASQWYGGYVSQWTRLAYQEELTVIGISVGTIKKHATGNGKADKSEMVASACVEFGIEISDHNEADALWLGDLARKIVLGEFTQ